MSSSTQPADEGVSMDSLMEDSSSYGPASDRLTQENAELLAELERKKRARKLQNVPTDDRKVRLRLRELGEPITKFGEGAADRYDRLRHLLSVRAVQRDALGEDEDADMVSDTSSDSDESDEEFYTEPPLPEELLAARRKIARFSLPLAQRRLRQQRAEAALPLPKILQVRRKVFGDLKKTVLLGSQIGDTRPISTVRFSPCSTMVATGSWTGGAKIWGVPNLNEVSSLKGHETHCRGLAWHPRAGLSQDRSAVNLASGGGEGTVKLWSLDSLTPLTTLSGHSGAVARVAFHPSGQYVSSASFDGSWRLWDLETSQELLNQEGHSKEVYAIGWQDDGALVATGGLDAIARVWDARTGKTVWVLDGHVKQITALDWSPNGFQLASGSADDSIKIWDMRKLACAYTIPAHKSLVSDLKFFRAANERVSDTPLPAAAPADGPVKKEEEMDISLDSAAASAAAAAAAPAPLPSSAVNRSGLYLVSSGYDSTVKVWSSDDWQLVKSINTDSGKVMGVDADAEGKFLVAGSGNRNFQLFGAEDAL